MGATRKRRAVAVLVPLVLGAAAFLLALLVTPATGVTAFGQDLRLGAVSPLALRGWSGPGQADLFGEGPVSTALVFDGPVRPRIVWQRFSRDPAAAEFVQTSGDAGPSFRTTELGQILARGWVEYVLRLVLVTAVLAGLLRLALTGASGARHLEQVHRRSRAARYRPVAAAVAAGMLLAASSVAATVMSARAQLAAVTSLADLTGTAPLVPSPVAAPAGSDGTGPRLVVIGDSTAAGVGNRPLPEPSRLDETCGRSRDAYAQVLGAAMQLTTLNLACSSATVENGLLGPQREGDVVVPPQVGVLKSLTGVAAVVVSVGANDVGWADFLRLCFGLERCDDRFSEHLFANRLDSFRIRYAQLLQQLSELPGHPPVVVLQYYDPFGEQFDCPALQDPNAPAAPPPGYGFAPDDAFDLQSRLRTKIDPMRARLAELDTVLDEGAQAFGFASVAPSFAGHALCAVESWVQGMDERYPFHPDAAGELAMAAAVLPELIRLTST